MQNTGIGHRGGVFHLRGITVQVYIIHMYLSSAPIVDYSLHAGHSYNPYRRYDWEYRDYTQKHFRSIVSTLEVGANMSNHE